MLQKYDLGSYKVNQRLAQKWEENILKFYFCFRSPTFSTHMPCPFKICFTNKVNTICGGGQLLVTGSLVSGSHVPGSQVLRPRVPVPESQGTKSQGHRVLDPRVSDLRDTGLRSQGPRSRVSGPDFRLCLSELNSISSVFLRCIWRQSVRKKIEFHPFMRKNRSSWRLRNSSKTFFKSVEVYSFFLNEELLIWKKSSHPGETSYLSEVSAEWCIFHFVKANRLYENGFIPPSWDFTSTQVRSHLGGMIFLHVNSFCQAVPPRQDCSFSLDSACFYIYYVKKCNSSVWI